MQPNCPKPDPIELKDYITWVLVVAGWVIGWLTVLFHQAKSENRRDTRALLDSIVAQIHTIEDNAYEYLTHAPDEKGKRLSMQIRRDLKSLQRALTRLKTYGVGQKSARELRETITGGDFDVAKRVKVDIDSGRVHEITAAVINLVTHLENEYSRVFAKKKKKGK